MASDKARVAVIALEKRDLEKTFPELITSLRDNFDVVMVESLVAAQKLFTNEQNLAAVLVTDAGIARPEAALLYPKLRHYVEDDAGNVVFCGLFSSATAADVFDVSFGIFNLGWKRGECLRTNFSLAPSTVLETDLPILCSMKASLVKAPGAAAVYLPSGQARSQHFAHAAADVPKDQTPVAFAPFGAGYVGYVGDVDAEEESTAVVLEMCRAGASRTQQQQGKPKPKQQRQAQQKQQQSKEQQAASATAAQAAAAAAAAPAKVPEPAVQKRKAVAAEDRFDNLMLMLAAVLVVVAIVGTWAISGSTGRVHAWYSD
jgi:hypothetical protein